jgi:alpha-glucosidase (family GH31 glycosyl hydrolase)
VSPNRYINITGQLTGGGSLVLFEGGISNPMQISGNSNTFSGQWIVKCGYLQGAGINSLGTNSITVDPNYVLASPPFDVSITSAQAGPAVFEVNYDLNSAGVLTLTNGGQMKLHQNGAFSAVKIEGTSLSAGTHSYSELNGTYPANFPAGGSGSITILSSNGSPTVGTQPASQTLYVSQTASFTVTASGTQPASYQWRVGAVGSGVYTNLPNGGQISGSTTTNLTISNLVAGNAADYVVVITNSVGSVTSSVATLTVLPASPTIGTQPASQTQYVGQAASFTVIASGIPPLSYQWRAGGTNSGVYTNLIEGGQISGSTTTNFSIANLTLSNPADFIVVITNSFGSVTGNVATLTVLPVPPPSTNVLESTALRLTVNANPFSFNVVEKSTGTVLLSQTSDRFTFGGTGYTASFAGNIVTTATTLDADLLFSGTSSTGHITFNFIQPGIIQTTLSSGNSTPSQIFQQFADQGEEMFGGFECPTGGTLSTRNFSRQLSASFGVSSIVSACGGKAPFYLTTRHYGIYAETDALGTLTFAQGGYTSFSFNVPQLTFDIIYGSTYADIMAGFNSRSGGALMPPIWMFDSIWWKDDDHGNFHNGVTNAQGNVLDTAIQLTNYQIHASAIWIDRPYGSSCGQGDGGWGNMDFDPANNGFNNPAQMVSDLHARGINLMLWIADLCWCNLYNQGLANGYLFSTGNNTAPNMQNTNAYHWFQTNLNAYVNLGIMGYKIDRGDQGELPDSVNNVNDTLFQQMALTGLSAAFPSNSYTFSRCASDTGRKYTGLWNGDTYCTFSGLQYSVISGLRAGIINFPMWGSDTGGYISSPSKPTEELFARWMEFSAYSTIMETVIGNSRTPWYDYTTNLIAITRTQCAAHHDLIPYSRSHLYQATQTGMPVMRPIMFAYPDDTNLVTTITNCEYMFGGQILVAPVITAGATTRNVYLPAANWLDYNTKSNLYVGPANITVPAPIQTIPLFVNEGAIIPRGDILQGNNLWTTNWSPRLRIEFFPSDNFGSSFPYYTGSSVQTITCSNQNHALTIQFGDLALGGNLEIYVENPGNVIRNGTNLTFGTDYTYDPTNNLLRVPFSGATTLVVNDATSLFGTFAPFEAWRLARFGNTGNPTISGASADPDGDGIPNFLEYAFGLNPLAASSNGLPFGSIQADSGTNYLALTFGRATNATDTTFTVMVASNLLSQWLTGSSYSGANVIPVTAYTTEVSRVPSNGIETITVRDNVPIHSAPQQFMRLRVTKP